MALRWGQLELKWDKLWWEQVLANEWMGPNLGHGSVSLKGTQRGNGREILLDLQSDNMSVQPWD